MYITAIDEAIGESGNLDRLIHIALDKQGGITTPVYLGFESSVHSQPSPFFGGR